MVSTKLKSLQINSWNLGEKRIISIISCKTECQRCLMWSSFMFIFFLGPGVNIMASVIDLHNAWASYLCVYVLQQSTGYTRRRVLLNYCSKVVHLWWRLLNITLDICQYFVKPYTKHSLCFRILKEFILIIKNRCNKVWPHPRNQLGFETQIHQ